MEHSVKRTILAGGLFSLTLLTGCQWAAQDDYYQPHSGGVGVQQVPQAYPMTPARPLSRPTPSTLPPAPAAPSANYSPRRSTSTALVPPPAPGVPIIPQSYQYIPGTAVGQPRVSAVQPLMVVPQQYKVPQGAVQVAPTPKMSSALSVPLLLDQTETSRATDLPVITPR